jgi:hypothetical protein
MHNGTVWRCPSYVRVIWHLHAHLERISRNHATAAQQCGPDPKPWVTQHAAGYLAVPVAVQQLDHPLGVLWPHLFHPQLPAAGMAGQYGDKACTALPVPQFPA